MPLSPATAVSPREITRVKDLPATFCRELFTAEDQARRLYLCCAAKPDQLPGKYLAIEITQDYQRSRLEQEIPCWIFLTLARPGQWFIARQPNPGSNILVLTRQDSDIRAADLIPQPEPVPSSLTAWIAGLSPGDFRQWLDANIKQAGVEG